MRNERAIDLAGRTVTVREMTVGEVRAWMADIATPRPTESVDLVAEMLIPGVSLADIRRMSDADDAALDAATPSEIAGLVSACKEINQDFFTMRAAVLAAALAVTSGAALQA